MDSMFWLFKQLVGVGIALVLIGFAAVLLFAMAAAVFEGVKDVARGIRKAMMAIIKGVIFPFAWVYGKLRKVTPEEQAERDRTDAAAERLAAKQGGDRAAARKIAEQRRQMGYEE